MTEVAHTAGNGADRMLALAASGDEDAFTTIVAEHHDQMMRVAFLVGGDLDVADDAVACAWRIAWHKLGTVREPDRLRPWLVTVAANEARRIARGRRRQAIREVGLDVGANARGGGDPGIRVGDLDLVNALARLDPDDRTLLALRYVAGFDSTEIGRATGRSASGTRARLGRLLARLRAELGNDDD
jgi:DNA-directed RNA polymerase specialized sigma24 family protein